MHCDLIFDPPGRATGFICGSGRRPKKRCVGCGGAAPRECDAHVPTRRSDTCDAAICADCSVHVEGLDLDACPKHANANAPLFSGCLLVVSYRERTSAPVEASPPGLPVPCAGAIIYPADLCLAHARLWGRWLKDGAYLAYFRPPAGTPPLTRPARRLRFMEWLDQRTQELR